MSVEDEIPDIDWEYILPNLRAYADSLLKNHFWFRKNSKTTYLKGKTKDDYVFQAIEMYLLDPEKYDQSKGTLENFLKYYLIRSIVSNDSKASENTTSISIHSVIEEENSQNYEDYILPHLQIYFEDEIDYNNIMLCIESEIKNDKILEEIFLGLCCYSLKRRDIINEFCMSESDYNNGIRRLGTILKKVAEKYHLKK